MQPSIFLIKPHHTWKTVPWLLVGMILLAGCALGNGANYGMLRWSRDVERAFEALEVLPDCKYYYSGPDARPDAIIGIQEAYTLKSRYWKAVDLTPIQLGAWIEWMTDFRGFSTGSFGADLLDPNGKRLGIWYSSHDRTTIEMMTDTLVVVHPPIQDQKPLLFNVGNAQD